MAPTAPEIETKVVELVSRQLGVAKDRINRESSFVNDLGADSLDTVELVMEIEEAFDLSIPDEAAEKIQRTFEKLTANAVAFEDKR